MRIRLALAASFCLSHVLWGAVVVDSQLAVDQNAASSTVTVAPFSTNSGQELLLAFISTDYLGGANTTVQSVSGGGLTWQLVGRANAQSGSSEIWRAFAGSPLISVSITANLSQAVPSSMTVVSFSGVDTSGSNGSGAIGATATVGAASGAPTASLTTTGSDSLIFGVGNDYDNATSRTPASGQSLVHQVLTSAGDTYWVQRYANSIPTSGTKISLNDTAPTKDRYNLAICEILSSQSVPTWSVSGSISPVNEGSGVSVAISGAATAMVTSDGSGHYTFAGLSNGNYTLTPTKPGFTANPANQVVTINGANQTGINFTIQPVPTWSISGIVSPAASGAGTLLTLSGASSGAVTADSGGNYAFTGLNNGNYTVTPSKSGFTFTPPSQSAPLNGVSVANANFTANAVPSGISIDAQVSKDQSSASTTVVSPAFSTRSGNELLLALIGTDYLRGSNTSVLSITGGGLTWTLIGRTNVQSGSSEIWRAFSASVLSSVTVTAKLSQSVASSMAVMSFSGVDSSGTNGSGAIGAVASANAAKGAPSATLVTTRNGSLVVGVGNDYDNASARTPAAGQALIHQYLSPAGDTYWMQIQNGPVALAGTSVSINDTAPVGDRYNMTACEILAGSGTGGTTAVPPTVTVTAPAAGTVSGTVTVAANVTDNVPVTGLQFFLDGTPLGSVVANGPYSISWDTSKAADGGHTLTAQAQNNAGQTATSTAVSLTVDNSANSRVVGSWSAPVPLPAVAVNLILLANNKILFYQDGNTPTVWDYLNNTFKTIPADNDIFCSGATLLADGRVFIAGGYDDTGAHIGIANAEIFDPSNNTWTYVPNMSYRRWYPNTMTLSDGRVLVTAGWQTTAHQNAGISEIYDPAKNTWTKLTNANNPFETYPFMYLMPDGRVIHIGGSEYATDTDILDIGAQTWSTIDSNIVDGSSATMYLPGKFIKAGTATDSQDSGPAANTTYILDATQSSPVWQQTAGMAYARSFMNLTMLPDGTVLATGGETDRNGGNIANAVYAAELWSPQTMTWSTMASMHTPREYHGTALLLPDGRVLESGMGADFGNVPDEKSAEFFSPPYLFKGPRPTITSAPPEWTYGNPFTVTTPDAANISKVALIRTGAVTHFFDENERYLPLSFQQGNGSLTVTAPANANLAPPGYYMLFILNSSGVPSVAPFVHFAGN